MSCDTKEENKTNQSENLTHTLKVVGSKNFELDSMTPTTTSCIAFLEATNQLVFINNKDNSIRIFDYKSGQQTKKITFQKEGDNGVILEAFHYHNTDSIFIHSRTGHVVLANDKGEIKNRIKVAGQTELGILASTICQMVWKEDKLYLLGTKFSHSYSPFVEVSFTNKTVNQNDFFMVSENYKNGHWGGMNFDFFCTSYNPATQKWVISFPVDEFLYYTDLEKNTEKAKAKSIYFDTIPPPYQNIEEANKDIAYLKKYLVSPIYYMVYYNPYNGYIYRVAERGIDEKEINLEDLSKSKKRPQSMIVLNEKKEQILEQELPENFYNLYSYFFTKEGLHIARKELENEDILTFDILKIENLLSK